MKLREGGDGFVLSTGRDVYAHHNLVSIPIVAKPDDNPTEFHEGYDGYFDVRDPTRHAPDEWLLTPDEGIEICDAMIAAWKARKKALKQIKVVA